MMTADEPMTFKFHWMNEQGQPAGFLRKKGSFDGTTLRLAEHEIPAGVILDVDVREARMVFVVPIEDGPAQGMGLVMSSKKVAERLKSALDIARSGTWAEQHREELVKAGRGDVYRHETCPRCSATVILSDMPETPQIFCHYCQTLTFPGDSEKNAQAADYRICDECGMFSRPTKFTIFYFYFLFVIYGWRTRTTWRCPACMRPDAWKMLFGNLPFVLGVPVAATQLARAYGGGAIGGPFAGLDAGNRAARAGKFSQAIGKYQEILERRGHAAGVKYNLGLALLNEEDKARAAEAFEVALADCANYGPAYYQLREIYNELGEKEKLERLATMWGEEGEGAGGSGEGESVGLGNALAE